MTLKLLNVCKLLLCVFATASSKQGNILPSLQVWSQVQIFFFEPRSTFFCSIEYVKGIIAKFNQTHIPNPSSY